MRNSNQNQKFPNDFMYISHDKTFEMKTIATSNKQNKLKLKLKKKK